MEKLRAAVASVTERVTHTLGALKVPASSTTDEQRGQGMAEYALILGLIAIAAIVSLIFLGTSITQLFDDIINQGFDYVTTLLGTP